MSQWNETFIFLACREHKHEKKFLLIGYIPSSLDCFSITKKLQRVFSRVLHFAWQFSCKWNWRRAILPQTQICKLVEWNLILTGAIHSTNNFQKFQSKLNGSVQSNLKSFKKTGLPFEVDHFSGSDRSEFCLNGSHCLIVQRGPVLFD